MLCPGGAKPAIVVGTYKHFRGGGQAVYLGFRPRDDQAASTGSEARAWYEILKSLGAYPASGQFPGNDNPTVISRTTNYLACIFPNGATALAPHYRDHEESWAGGFFRDVDADQRILEEYPAPSDEIDLHDFQVAGQTISYQGRHAVAWRCSPDGKLAAFAGIRCTGIVLNGTSITWSDLPVDIGWHPVSPTQKAPGFTPLCRVWCGTPADVRLPLDLTSDPAIQVWLGADVGGFNHRKGKESFGRTGYGMKQVDFEVDQGWLMLRINEETAGNWLYVVKAD
jgi:hypothetical protein